MAPAPTRKGELRSGPAVPDQVYVHVLFKVTVHLLQDDGSIGGAALTAAGLAVLDNGISIRRDTLVGGAEMVASDSVGPFKMDTFASALSLARMGAEQIFSFYKEMMERKLSVDVFTKPE
ncbi:hypothetical protein TELCIR_10087 [Teladorsagia circumcincta]|uniref:Uncharacterized protein n=1 Tax=Teladorsagia circumcincta TaxID=45464 RepID=A0A2G9UD12_TELCI|nr:hypothetical protein TELCIR_10087 [Teladorsagia circumcincta]